MASPMRGSWVICCLLLAWLVIAEPCHARQEDSAPARQRLTVVADDACPPYLFRGEDGALQGILVDQWALWEKATGIRVILLGMTFTEAQRSLAEGAADVADAFFYNESLAASCDFGPSYAHIEVQLFISGRFSGPTDFSSLRGNVVCVKEGDPSINILADHGLTALRTFPNFEALANAAAHGDVDLFCMDKPAAMYYLDKLHLEKEFRTTRSLYHGQLHRAVKKGNQELLQLVQNGFSRISEQDYVEVQRRWTGSFLGIDSRYLRYTFYALAAAAAVFLAMLFRNWNLRRTVDRKTRESEATLNSLRESEAQFRLLTENANDVIWTTDLNGKLTYISPSIIRLRGFTPEEAMQQSVEEALPPASLAVAMDAIAELHAGLEQGSIFPSSRIFELEQYCKDGSTVWTEAVITPIYDDAKVLRHILGISRDITERKRAQATLRETEEQLARTQELSLVMMTHMTLDGRWIKVPQRFCVLLGYTELELLTRRVHDIAHPEDIEAYWKQCQRLMQGEERSFDLETRYLRKDGGVVWLYLNCSIVHDARRRPSHFLVYLRDISEQKKTEEEQQRLQTQIQQMQKLESLGVLAGGIAHDFNNILMVILGNAELTRCALPEGSTGFDSLDAIERATHRAAGLCRQMLAYSGRGRLTIEPIDLTEIVRETVHMIEITIPKKVRLRCHLDSGLPAIEADPAQVRQAVMNLIVNASEAINDGEGEVSVSTSSRYGDAAFLAETRPYQELSEGHYVCVEVADTGCGMDHEMLARIFDPFFSTKFTGRGLGLAAVLGIVRSHKGGIRIASEVGRGSAFTMLFPAAPALTVPNPSREVTEERPTWRGHGTVLLVDDEPEVRNIGARLLEELGFSPLLAATGEEAVELFRQHAQEVVCVLLDLIMPGMDGEETFHALRNIRPEVCAVVCTGYSKQDMGERFTERKPAGSVLKPYTLSELAKTLQQVLPPSS